MPAANVDDAFADVGEAVNAAYLANNLETPPPSAVLPAPMIEPIVSDSVDDLAVPIPSEASALTRVLSRSEKDNLIDSARTMPDRIAAEPVTVTKPSRDDLLRTPNQALGGPITPPLVPPPLQPKLVVVRGERLTARPYPILEGENYIGRSVDRPVDIDLEGQEAIEQIWVSRRHAVITFRNNEMVLEDLNSLNGTFVNRTRVHPGQKCVIKAGDVIQIGTVQLRVAT
ncbi:FHA domain containing protein [Fimbriiglobus ruber]|uniref:FHA domain containing protein n=1 Tax=Fimbriiglobus ruber TaxID=1908690 RepID=A0A225E2C1_9BACT|nr:FHA domain containing protein [Fimbriiglobus ruber]